MATNLLAEWLTPTTIGGICTAAGVAITKIVDWVLTRRKAQSDLSNEAIKTAHTNQAAVVAQLFELVKTLRTDMAEMRAELEESEGRRAKAEDTVRKLRDEVHDLRNELSRRGLAAPPPK